MICNKGFSLIEMMIVLAILIILGLLVLNNFRGLTKVHSIETDTKRIHAFAQKKRMTAFSKKIDLFLSISGNGTKLCETVENVCITLDNTFSSSGVIGITDRGTYTTGNIHIATVEPDAAYSCVVFSATRARLGKWDGTNCNAQ